jgi:hypothetical protein
VASASSSQGPFSRPNRVRLIDEYFADRTVDPAAAWMDVYRLLLWIDSRTGIAHCYESDKSQPGKPWYPRSLVFHEWVSRQMGVDSLELKDYIDWMFRQVIGDVTQAEADEMIREAMAVQQELFAEDEAELPVPGDDPRLHAIVEPLMSRDPRWRPSEHEINDVLRKVYAHMSSENKRANLLGRGFEDVLAGVLARLPNPPAAFGTQTPLENIPGFRATREGDKTEKVDLWVGDGGRRRVLVTAKWSVRADREKQLPSDFATYERSNAWRDPFEYVWITNEFDPARLVANATYTTMNRNLFDVVVHICPQAVWEVHHLDDSKGPNPTRLRELMDEGRVISLEDWLALVTTAPQA